MKFIVFYLEFINSLEGPGMFFSSAAIIRRLRSYAATGKYSEEQENNTSGNMDSDGKPEWNWKC